MPLCAGTGSEIAHRETGGWACKLSVSTCISPGWVPQMLKPPRLRRALCLPPQLTCMLSDDVYIVQCGVWGWPRFVCTLCFLFSHILNITLSYLAGSHPRDAFASSDRVFEPYLLIVI